MYHTWVPAFPVAFSTNSNRNGGLDNFKTSAEYRAAGGPYFTRVCAQVYNDESDFKYLADSVLQVLKHMNQLQDESLLQN